MRPTRPSVRMMVCSLATLSLLVSPGIRASGAVKSAAETPAVLPNVLVIVTDDQRATGTLDVMPTTLQVFQRNGTQFSNAFASTPLCCPARASIFSGRYAHNHGVFRTSTDPAVFDQESTMQAGLERAGYLTAITGKYLNNWNQSLNPPHFDRWAFFSRGAQPNSEGYYDLTFNVDGTPQSVEKYSTNFIRNRAISFLRWFEREDDRPWFLYVAPFAPHAPALPQPKFSNAAIPLWTKSPAIFEEDVGDKPVFMQFSHSKPWRVRRLRANQLRSLMSVDELVERVFAQLESLGEKRDTLAIFMSDNGFHWGEHGRGGKSLPYTASTQIPMLMRWPGHVMRGAIDSRLVSNVDIAPTVLDAAGVSGGALDGRSLLDAWQRDRVLLEFWEGEKGGIPRWASLRTASHQYTEYYITDSEVVLEREYYDLRADPWQLENLVADEDSTNDPPQWIVDLLAADRRCMALSCP